MNRAPSTGDIIQLPAKRGDMFVLSSAPNPTAPSEILLRMIPASKADKITGIFDDKDAISAKILNADLPQVRLIGTTKFVTKVTTTYKITKRKDVV